MVSLAAADGGIVATLQTAGDFAIFATQKL